MNIRAKSEAIVEEWWQGTIDKFTDQKHIFKKNFIIEFKGCVRCIFASLFFKSKLEHLSNWERCFLFHFKSSFCSQENQILEFCIFKFHDVIKCLSIKQEMHFTE